MVVKHLKKLLKVFKCRMNYSRRERIAIFMGKCFMLRGLVYDSEISYEELDDIIEAMFAQSLAVIGWQ